MTGATPAGGPGVVLREMRWWDIEPVLGLERVLFPEDAWSRGPVLVRTRPRPRPAGAPAATSSPRREARTGPDVVALRRARRGRRHRRRPDHRRPARATAAPASARGCWRTARRGRAASAATRCCWRSAWTTPPHSVSTSASASTPSAYGAATTSPATSTPWSCAWSCPPPPRRPLSQGTEDPWLTNPSSSASRPPATRPASASSAGTRCSPTRSPPAWTSTPASAASCPRSPAARTWRRWSPPSSARCARPGSPPATWTASRSPRAPGSRVRCWSACQRRQGVRVRARQAALRRQPPRLAHLRRPAGARRAARADDGPARLRRPLLAAAGARTSPRTYGRSARPSTTRRARPSTRWPACSNLGFPGGPVIDRYAREGDPEGHRLPARADGSARRPVRLLLLRPQDGRRPLDRGQAQRGRGGARARRGRVVPGGGHGRADPQGDPGLQGQGRGPSDDRRRRRRQLPAALHGRRSAARTRASRCGCRGPSCARTTARWSPRWAPRWSPAAAPRPTGTCPRTPRCRSRTRTCLAHGGTRARHSHDHVHELSRKNLYS